MFVDKIPGPDEEGYVLSVENHPGGSAPNTIVGLSRLEVRTGLIGRVGNDVEGDDMVSDLREEGVETRGIQICEGRSGTALSMVNTDGVRALIIDPGVNDTVEMSDIDIDYVGGFELLHLSSFICKNTELSFRTQIELAKRVGIPLSLDPGQLYAERDLSELEPLISRCRVILPNQGELEMMTGVGMEEGAEKLIDMGCDLVVVKRGMDGCYLTDGDMEERVQAYGEKGKDTTGAGDAFNAGFIYSIINGFSPVQAAEMGTKVACFSVHEAGARKGLPSLDQLMSD